MSGETTKVHRRCKQMQSAITEWRERGRDGGMDGGRRNPRGCLLFFLKCIYATMFVRLFPFRRQPPPLLWKRENSRLPSAAAAAARRGEGRRGEASRGSTLTLRQDGRRLRPRLECAARRSGGGHGRPNVTGHQFTACASFLPFTSPLHPSW